MNKTQLKQQIADGKTNQTIESLLTLTTATDLYDEVVLQSSRFKQLMREKHQNTMDGDTMRIELAKINHALLDIIDRLDKAEKQPTGLFDWFQANRKLAFGLIGIVVAAIIGMVALSMNGRTFNFTVYVHGKGGKEDKILRGDGSTVRLYLNSNPEKQPIDKDGRAIFTEISPTFLNKKVRIDIDHPQHYQSTHPDSLFLLTDNGVIYLETALLGMDKIVGKVMDEKTEDYIEGVRVSVYNVETFTDKNGYFELIIPEAKQQKFQRLSFEKKGYVNDWQDSIPVHTQQIMVFPMRRK
jgi:Effector-associated domain 11